MQDPVTATVVLAAFLLGAALSWAILRRHQRQNLAQAEALAAQTLAEREADIAELRQELTRRQTEHNQLQLDLGRLREDRAAADARARAEAQAAAEKLALLEQAEANLKDAFKALSAESLKASQENFLGLARQVFEKHQQGATADLSKRQEAIQNLVEPVRQKLSEFDQHVRGLEKNRESAYAGLLTQVRQLTESNQALRTETGNLVTALRSPQVRGRWGEMQLRRAVELAGMEPHINFTEQASIENDAGERLRPDMTVDLPNDRVIVVDSKVPLAGYDDALRAQEPDAHNAALQRHARLVRDHIKQLGGKAYFDAQARSPDFVVLFLPGEAFLSAALREEPTLLDYGFERRVILATPTTLVALLKGVAYAWSQVALTEQAARIAGLGKEIYERLSDFGGHFDNLRKGLERAVKSYNSAVGSLESRVLPTARKFPELAVASQKELEALAAINESPRSLQANELTPTDDDINPDSDNPDAAQTTTATTRKPPVVREPGTQPPRPPADDPSAWRYR